ncbi:NagC family transcriptional regulator [Bifidobacterium dolichotidis]|uniref:NagC family transcriptional regulator n=1 Tax=Bifidobacterium dolichotidis TaxID=2306976 RepID=A0A430FPL6_9BIFI|nr:ROK family transcriptional regulator [Bifidobacterium dolichotidis]RSX54782.1 NagC family transcriptional regulator [Bifidobacterium dolichotidis]
MARRQISQATLSEHNRSRVLHYLFRNGTVSRANIAKALELTPAAITKITAKLLESGLIEETGDLEGKDRRRSIGIRLNTHAFHIASVKFARTLIRIGLFDLAGNELEMSEITAIDHRQIPEAVESVRAKLNAMIRADARIAAIGMAVPGPYLRRTGRTAMVSSMQEWRSVNFIDEFSHAFRVPVVIEQDARAGALAFRLFDSEHTNRHLAYYLIGEGVGLGVIDGDDTINGELGAATEIGHVSIDYDGPLCECGNHGCLECYCSAVAIHNEVNKLGLIEDSENLTHRAVCEMLFHLAFSGNSEAIDLVQRIGTYVGYGAVSIINAFNPKRIMIGDIVAGGGDLLLSAVQKVVNERVLPELAAATEIQITGPENDATARGAAAVAIEQLLSNPSEFVDVL